MAISRRRGSTRRERHEHLGRPDLPALQAAASISGHRLGPCPAIPTARPRSPSFRVARFAASWPVGFSPAASVVTARSFGGSSSPAPSATFMRTPSWRGSGRYRALHRGRAGRTTRSRHAISRHMAASSARMLILMISTGRRRPSQRSAIPSVPRPVLQERRQRHAWDRGSINNAIVLRVGPGPSGTVRLRNDGV